MEILQTKPKIKHKLFIHFHIRMFHESQAIANNFHRLYFYSFSPFLTLSLFFSLFLFISQIVLNKNLKKASVPTPPPKKGKGKEEERRPEKFQKNSRFC